MRFEEFLWYITFCGTCVTPVSFVHTLLRRPNTESIYHMMTLHAHHKSVTCSKSAALKKFNFQWIFDLAGLFREVNWCFQLLVILKIVWLSTFCKICLMINFFTGNRSLSGPKLLHYICRTIVLVLCFIEPELINRSYLLTWVFKY